MKFVSPDQRGTTWRWTWSAIPAPATRPRFQPRLKPSGAVEPPERVDRRHGEVVELEHLAARQVGELADVAPWRDHHVPRRVRVLVQQCDGVGSLSDEERPSAPSAPAPSRQNTQPSCSSACVTYSSRHGAQRDFVMSRF